MTHLGLLALLLTLSPAAFATNYALLMNIGDYPVVGVRDTHDLPGTTADMKAFRKFAVTKLNVPEKNITLLREQEVSRAGVTQAIKQLIGKVGERDQVLIAYSGHGGQVRDPGSQKASGCSEGIITVEGKTTGFLPDRELRPLFDALADQAGKVIVFFDSCFSGGAMTTRAMNTSDKFKPKYYAKGEAISCGTAVNMRGLTRGLADGKPNFVYIAAAAHNEVAIDAGDEIGGMATSAWMQCLNDSKADADRSGGISAAELVRCAQAVIDRSGADGSPIQHITVEGAAGTVLAFNQAEAVPTTATTTSTSKPATTTTATTTTSTLAPLKPPAQPVPAPQIFEPPPAFPTPFPQQIVQPVPAIPVTTTSVAATATLQDIYNSRNAKWNVRLKAPKTKVKINVDMIDLTIASARAGYVYLFMVGTDNDGAYLLFPNEYDQDNAIKAGKTLSLPKKSSWRIRPGGPPGTDQLLAIVSDRKLDFDEIGMNKEVIFRKSGNRPVDLAKLQMTIVSAEKRSLFVEAVSDLSYNYGAARLEIVEVK